MWYSRISLNRLVKTCEKNMRKPCYRCIGIARFMNNCSKHEDTNAGARRQKERLPKALANKHYVCSMSAYSAGKGFVDLLCRSNLRKKSFQVEICFVKQFRTIM